VINEDHFFVGIIPTLLSYLVQQVKHGVEEPLKDHLIIDLFHENFKQSLFNYL
jgi:hypothetical protein